MTEDIPHFHDKNAPWRLSGRDGEILAELRVVLRSWIPGLKKADEIASVVQAIADIEELEATGKPPNDCRIDMNRIDLVEGGQSAAVSLTPHRIALELTQWMPSENGGLDKVELVDRHGRRIGMQLDHMGSYNRVEFDGWRYHAMKCGPQGPIDPSSEGEVAWEKTTGHAAVGFH